jgi:hypothetical protein
MTRNVYYLLVVQLALFTFARINQLDLAGAEADQKRCTLTCGGRTVEVMTTGICTFV